MNYKYIIVLYFFGIFFSNAQTQDTLQKISYHSAMEQLKLNDLEVSFYNFKSAYLTNTENELGKNASIKLDSLTKILRNRLLTKIKGVWKRTDIDSLNEILIITEKDFCFYKCENEAIRLEKINFNEDKGYFFYFFELIFSDNKFWKVFVSYKDILSMENQAEILENGKGIRKNHCDVMTFKRLR